MTGLANPKCYARELNDCSPKMSREHYVSDALQQRIAGHEKLVKARGLAFQKSGEIQTFPIDGMASRILCDKHNSALSIYDSAADQFGKALQRLNAAEAGEKGEPETHVINGDLLERWALKTMIGCLTSGAMQKEGANSMKGHLPPKEWLDHLYSGVPIDGGKGLYLVPGQASVGLDGQRSNFGVSVLSVPRASDPEVTLVVGARIYLLGFELNLKLLRGNLHPEGLTDANFRPAGIRADGNPVTIRFEWADGPSGPELRLRGSLVT
ncbi:MAG: hypothetical protein K8U57_36990 [Planctomycetes bacterium]|nr:hypothetical protein [Planctomycetota bacterium]